MKQQWYIMEEVMPCANINMHLKFSFKDELRNGKKWYTDMISWKKKRWINNMTVLQQV